ncbi:hypothetical protein GW17_00037868 [Ensete ventricosum]|nr:hypothetical protein GW17_00037868 [Ensete ventricosum]
MVHSDTVLYSSRGSPRVIEVSWGMLVIGALQANHPPLGTATCSAAHIRATGYKMPARSNRLQDARKERPPVANPRGVAANGQSARGDPNGQGYRR